MGIILPWPDKSARAKVRASQTGELLGQIIFFTGVRYERHPPDGDASPKNSQQQQGRRKRRRA